MTIGGADCAVTSASNTELECVTGPHMGSAVTVVEVEVAGNGIAEEVEFLKYWKPVGAAIVYWINHLPFTQGSRV